MAAVFPPPSDALCKPSNALCGFTRHPCTRATRSTKSHEAKWWCSCGFVDHSSPAKRKHDPNWLLQVAGFLAEPSAERRALLIVHANFGEFVNAANLGK